MEEIFVKLNLPNVFHENVLHFGFSVKAKASTAIYSKELIQSCRNLGSVDSSQKYTPLHKWGCETRDEYFSTKKKFCTHNSHRNIGKQAAEHMAQLQLSMHAIYYYKNRYDYISRIFGQ